LRYGSWRRSTACATLKIAALAPTASITVAMTPALNVGACAIARTAWRRSWRNARMGSGHLVDAHPVVVVDGAAAHVPVARIDGGVDRRAAFFAARPSSLGAGHDARTDAIAHVGDGQERAARVGDAHLVPRRDPPRRGVVGMDEKRRRPRPLPLPRHVGEDGV